MAEITISGYQVLVDDEDVERILKHKWYIKRHDIQYNLYYFIANGNRSGGRKNGMCLTLHRYIMGCSKNDGIYIDHINGNTLDCRKQNLRRCSHAENMQNRRMSKKNTSGYKGVTLLKDGTYVAGISYNNRARHICQGNDPIICAKEYDKLAIKFQGDFACINFPKESYSLDEIEEAYKKFTSILSAVNKTGYMGVSYNNSKKKYVSQIVCNKINYWLGYYETALEATIARDKKAYELLGDRAKLNFPERIEEYKANA